MAFFGETEEKHKKILRIAGPIFEPHYSRFVFLGLRPHAGHEVLILEVSNSHTSTYCNRYDSSG
jgi:hypothetical protein